MKPFARNVLFFITFPIFTHIFGKFLLHFDVNKRAYNHVPGECGIIPNLPGILSVTTSTGGRLYLTTNSKNELSRQKHLFTFYADNRTAREIQIKGTPSKFRFNPGPMSITGENSTPYAFVSIRDAGLVALFKTDELNEEWKYQKTFKNENFEGLKDISGTGPNSFYFLKSSIFGEAFAINLLERIIPMPTGEIYFANQNQKQNSVHHFSYISSPTGIAYDDLKKSIFVTSFARNSIYAMRIKRKNKIESYKEYDIGCSPTSIWRDFDGSFLVTCHPVRFQYFLHLLKIINSSPSMVLRVVIPADRSKDIPIITQLYSNDGATISQANVTVRAGRSLLISDGSKILNCHL